MVRLNKHVLTDKQLDNLFKQLNTTLSKLSPNQTNQFLSALLGKEERIMLAKRLATIILLLENNSLYKTSRLLKISTGTATKIKTKLTQGHYDGILSILKKDKQDYFQILKTLDSILHLGGILPHYQGLDRYKNL